MRAKAIPLIVVAAAATVLVSPARPASAAEPGSATVVPIQVTGDPVKRFNLVILGDGYTEAELPVFRSHVDRHVNVMWSIEPFRTYRTYFNVYAVEIVSAESGVDCDPSLTSLRRNTPLNMGFWGGCNPNSVQRSVSVSGAAASSYANLVAGTNPGNRQIVALANSRTYGGAGGVNATASGGNALSALISPHELGHSLGGLQDEYDYFQRGVPGGAYAGPEPTSIHHTLRTEQQMRDAQAKWWRWLGEPSESGGTIGRYEGGMYLRRDLWRPSRHSMMKSLGYYFDQVGRERMTQRIAAKVSLIQDSTSTVDPIGADRVVWVETLHPVRHELDVTWAVDGVPVLGTGNARSIDLRTLAWTPGRHALTATVVDPTDFVRDPAVRSSPALTQSRMWTVDTSVSSPAVAFSDTVAFTAVAPAAKPVSAEDVVYVETTHPSDRVPAVRWAIDGVTVPNPGNDRDIDLKRFRLTPGRHALTAQVGAETRAWTVDATAPLVSYDVSRPLVTVVKPGRPTEYLYNGPFTMRLAATDTTAGHVVAEFRLDGDGWHHYYGWPTDANLPFLFTASGTNIDDLVYGNLGPGGLSLSPFADRAPGYGRHTVEYRGIDATGNIGTADAFVATLVPPPPACTTTVSGRHTGPLVVRTGVTCLRGATVAGPVTVLPGASLVAEDASIAGPVTSLGAVTVQLLNTTVRGPVVLTRTTGDITAIGSRVHGPLTLTGNVSPVAAIVAGNNVATLVCAGNTPAPVNLQAPNTVHGPATGQCGGL